MDGFRQALLGAFGISGNIPAPIEATFRHVINQMTATGMLERFGEEEISGALLGGFAAAFPLCLGIFTDSGDEATQLAEQHKCAWGQYNKSRTGNADHNESDRGADFSLVVWSGSQTARLALFQAKRFEASQPTQKTIQAMVPPSVYQPLWPVARMTPVAGIDARLHYIDVHRERTDAAGNVVGMTQMATLATTARRIMAVRRLSSVEQLAYDKARQLAEGPVPAYPSAGDVGDIDVDEYLAILEDVNARREEQQKAKATLQAIEAKAAALSGVQHLHWVHYVGYARSSKRAKASAHNPIPSALLKSGAVCVPMSALAPQLSHEQGVRSAATSRTLVDLSAVVCYRLVDVILNAFAYARNGEDVAGWITVDAHTVELMLPELHRFGHVVMGTDKGGAGLALMNRLNGSMLSMSNITDFLTSVQGFLPPTPTSRPGM